MAPTASGGGIRTGAKARAGSDKPTVVIPAKAGIQYSEALVFKPKCRGVLDPRFRGDDVNTHGFAIPPHHLREFFDLIPARFIRGHGECRTLDASAVPREV